MPAPSPAPAPAPTPAPKPTNTSASASHTHSRVAVLGPAGGAARDAISFVEQLGMTSVHFESLDQLESLRNVQFALVLPPAEAPDTLLAIGFLLALLPAGCVCVVAAPGEPAPADLPGALHIKQDAGGLWHLMLGRAMRRAGLHVDMNKLL